MKKLVMFGIIVSFAALPGSAAIAENKSVKSEATQEVNTKTASWLGIWIEKLPISLSKHLACCLGKHTLG